MALSNHEFLNHKLGRACPPVGIILFLPGAHTSLALPPFHRSRPPNDLFSIVIFIFGMIQQLFLGRSQSPEFLGNEIADPGGERQAHAGGLILGEPLERGIQGDIGGRFLQQVSLRFFCSKQKSFIGFIVVYCAYLTHLLWNQCLSARN